MLYFEKKDMEELDRELKGTRVSRADYLMESKHMAHKYHEHIIATAQRIKALQDRIDELEKELSLEKSKSKNHEIQELSIDSPELLKWYKENKDKLIKEYSINPNRISYENQFKGDIVLKFRSYREFQRWLETKLYNDSRSIIEAKYTPLNNWYQQVRDELLLEYRIDPEKINYPKWFVRSGANLIQRDVWEFKKWLTKKLSDDLKSNGAASRIPSSGDSEKS